MFLRDGLRRLRHCLSSERGVSIPEMLVAMVLASATAGLIGTAIYQFIVVGSDGADRLEVLGAIENAALWLGRDASESQTFTLGSGAEYGILTTGDPAVEYRYSYDAGNTALVREHLVSSVVQSTQRVARRIADQGDIVFTVNGNLLTVSITATSADGSMAESADLSLHMRVE